MRPHNLPRMLIVLIVVGVLATTLFAGSAAAQPEEIGLDFLCENEEDAFITLLSTLMTFLLGILFAGGLVMMVLHWTTEAVDLDEMDPGGKDAASIAKTMIFAPIFIWLVVFVLGILVPDFDMGCIIPIIG